MLFTLNCLSIFMTRHRKLMDVSKYIIIVLLHPTIWHTFRPIVRVLLWKLPGKGLNPTPNHTSFCGNFPQIFTLQPFVLGVTNAKTKLDTCSHTSVSVFCILVNVIFAEICIYIPLSCDYWN